MQFALFSSSRYPLNVLRANNLKSRGKRSHQTVNEVTLPHYSDATRFRVFSQKANATTIEIMSM